MPEPGRITDLVEALGRRYSPPPLPSDPLELILWENIGYLIDDQRRRILFDMFASTVGVDAARIDAADDAVLMAVAVRGGMRPETRVGRWREIARLVLDRCGGDLAGALKSLPLSKARALLKAFPAIGDPGADKVLLFSGASPRPCLESNGLRALARLGYFAEQGAYASSYRLAIEALVAGGRSDGPWLIDAYVRLRELGKDLCRRGQPHCLPCPLDARCAHAVVLAL